MAIAIITPRAPVRSQVVGTGVFGPLGHELPVLPAEHAGILRGPSLSTGADPDRTGRAAAGRRARADATRRRRFAVGRSPGDPGSRGSGSRGGPGER
jgi:hypothetical protein